jgi:hypothetical protein
VDSLDTLLRLEARVASLETSLSRTRLLASSLGVALALIFAAGFTPQAQEEVSTQRLVLTTEEGTPALTLRAGPRSSLVIQSPTGEEMFRLGGSPARRIAH